MSFDWKEYLELAKRLIGQPGAGYSQEAAERSAVSRAYYAAFCWARNYAKANLGFRPTGGAEDHRRLREHLGQSDRSQLASHLNRLRGWRNACDYNDRVLGLSRMVNVAIRVADRVIQACR